MNTTAPVNAMQSITPNSEMISATTAVPIPASIKNQPLPVRQGGSPSSQRLPALTVEERRSIERLMEEGRQMLLLPDVEGMDDVLTKWVDALTVEDDVKGSFGSSQSHSMSSPLSNLQVSPGSVDSLSSRSRSFSTGSSSSLSAISEASELSGTCLVPFTQSSPEAKKRKTTSGKRLPGFTEPSLSLDANPFVVIPQQIGTGSGTQQFQDELKKSLPAFAFKITRISERSLETILNLLLSNESFTSIGATVALARAGVLGKKLLGMLTLRIPSPNSGVDTKVKRMLSSMNLKEYSVSIISKGGSIGTQRMWKPRVDQFPSSPKESGSRRTKTPKTGGPKLPKKTE